METQTALPQILAHKVGRLKRVEFPEAGLQTRPFCSFEPAIDPRASARCIASDDPRLKEK
jgi:hypothetical protein